MKKVIILIIIACISITFYIYYFLFYKNSNKQIIINTDSYKDLIVVISPLKDSEISSPLTISGRAKSEWFSDGIFPITLLDAYGNTIADGHASSQGEWKKDEFIKFIGTLQFNNYIKGQNGKLKLIKGIKEQDEKTIFIEIPIRFK